MAVSYTHLNLPDGSGLDLCEEIRNRGQHTYIIFITANDKESDMLKGCLLYTSTTMPDNMTSTGLSPSHIL